MKKYKVKAKYFSRAIEFIIQTENLAIALKEGEVEAKKIFFEATGNLLFWAENSNIHVKEV